MQVRTKGAEARWRLFIVVSTVNLVDPRYHNPSYWREDFLLQSAAGCVLVGALANIILPFQDEKPSIAINELFPFAEQVNVSEKRNLPPML